MQRPLQVLVTDVNEAPIVSNAIVDQVIAEDIRLSFQFIEIHIF